MTATNNNSKPYIPVAGIASDGWSTKDQATATCYCGTVQLIFPTRGPGLVDTFACHCTDCRKITASMFATNFIVADPYLKHVRGEEALTKFSQSKTTTSGKAMANFFCSKCGTLMYRTGELFPGQRILRTGTVDDFTLHETTLKPRAEIYTKDRVGWLCSAKGVGQVEGVALPAKDAGIPNE
ncbi:hypothetical protein Asppvi_005703 [Aspergillus pseudoviridinutans]|uniref:CENP-V/GFA domain-containing protein n=1 Tax=Aspergillus pseudoviridinutans TaxID=1517512 RepID=A0A9P3B8P3_9EURO|nr:uncharacterized protein Asppvi_005703 [Aspergillus pseudoviridinutans]GIJ86807.1 hypothetical protein Asppvi_005703 [Aspergillus pseudoviridinutans]